MTSTCCYTEADLCYSRRGVPLRGWTGTIDDNLSGHHRGGYASTPLRAAHSPLRCGRRARCYALLDAPRWTRLEHPPPQLETALPVEAADPACPGGGYDALSLSAERCRLSTKPPVGARYAQKADIGRPHRWTTCS
eukprot:scaffold764_cov408-Prasinococcus_capsulatus_cf.AAC.18